MSNTQPSNTPNVVIANPVVRRIANVVIGTLAIVVPLAVVIDLAAPEFDISAYTTPAMAALLFVAGMFGLSVTTPNIPRSS